jgi:transcription elongation factor B subunit 1
MNGKPFYIPTAGDAELISSSAAVVETLLEYLTYKSIWEKSSGKEEIPDFMERIAPEVALEL